MDAKTIAKIKEMTPKFNPQIASGYASHRMKYAMRRVGDAVKNFNDTLPDGVHCEGIRMATPQETLRYRTKKEGNRYIADKEDFPIDEQDVYLCYLIFDVCGTKVEHPIYMNFIRDFNIYYLRDTPYMLSPVLSDNGMSVHDNYIYIALSTIKFRFHRLTHAFMSERGMEHEYVVHSNFHNGSGRNSSGSKPKNPVTSAMPTMANYLFVKYGVKNVFENMAGVELVDIINTDGEEYEKYPKEEFAHFTQAGRKPAKFVQNEYFYQHTGIRLIFRKDVHESRVAKKLLAGFFYVLDHMGQNITAETFQSFEEEQWFWLNCLGSIHHPHDPALRRPERVNGHIESIEVYLDEHYRKDLSMIGVDVESAWELFYYMIENMDTIMQSKKNRASVYGTRLLVEKYALDPIIKNINEFMMGLKNRPESDLTNPDKFRSRLRGGDQSSRSKNIRSNLALEMIRGNSQNHGEVDTVSYPGDCPVINITTNLCRQEHVNTNKKADINIHDPANHLDSSLAEVCMYIATGSKDLTGRGFANMYLQLDERGGVLRDEELHDQIEDANEFIRRG